MSNSIQDTNLIGNTMVVQIALLVRDIETTMQNWRNLLGVKNYGYKLTDVPEVTQIQFKGEPTPARAKIGFVKLGQVTLELIEPDHNPSIWREYLDEHGEGFHHIAFKIEGMDEKIELFGQNGMQLIQSANYTNGRYAYMDSENPLKLVIELLEDFK